MTCRQAFDLDLPAFLASPRDAQFADFVDHYPRCPECAAEIRTWTELDETLRRAAPTSPHPDPELLVRFQADPATLEENERTSTEAHVASCIGCRDELTSLRAFVLSGPPIAEPATRKSAEAPSRLASILAGLRGIVWQPAFAYALLVLALVPSLYSQLGPDGIPRPQSIAPASPAALSEPAPKRKAPALVVKERRAPERKVAVREVMQLEAIQEEALLQDTLQKGFAGEDAPRRSISVKENADVARKKSQPDIVEELKVETMIAHTFEFKPDLSPLALPRLTEEEIPVAQAEIRESRDMVQAPSELPHAPHTFGNVSGIASSAKRRSKDMQREAFTENAMRSRMAFAPTGGNVVRLALLPDNTPVAPSEALEAGLLLRIPLPRTATKRRIVEVTVFAPGGERELVERHNLAANRLWIESPLPAAWLIPGEFSVLVEVENEAPREHSFSIRAPAESHSR